MVCLGRHTTAVGAAPSESNARLLVGADDGDILDAAYPLAGVVILLLQLCETSG